MIDVSRLLDDCQRLVRLLEDDLRDRLREHPELDARVQSEFERAKERQRTGQSYTVWRDEYLTQVAVHWVLAAVFVRFLEDNELLPEPWISGPGPRLGQARDHHERFFVREPAASDRDYLLACFRGVERLPAMAPLFDERHNPLFKLGPTADGARAIVELFRRPRPEGGLLHDFSDPDWSTRFLGDLYQDLSEAARKRYALLQTPEFVEEFLLDRTLEPAIAEVGYQKVTLIDPACGSGHFLLGAFHRLFDRWRKNDVNTNEVGLAAKALDQIAGVDLNPFAVAIARFRLLIAALKVSGLGKMAGAPTFPLKVAAGDSLLHGGPRQGHIAGQTHSLFGADEYGHYYSTEDEDELRRLLGRQYTVVVGNPPYITPKDRALSQLYRDRFKSCHRQYSLAVPFTERFFDLAARMGTDQVTAAGWVGMITANSFMKREFGKKLIEKYIPRWDLTHIIDTSGAYLPGHGTPTVILIGRNRPPASGVVRAVLGIKGEPSTPEDPAQGLVWSAIVEQLGLPGSQSDFVSVADLPRERFHHHPWAVGGGGSSDLKDAIEESAARRLRDVVSEIGFGVVTREDEAYRISERAALRYGIERSFVRPLAIGEDIRDWSVQEPLGALWPYDQESLQAKLSEPTKRFLWPWRRQLSERVAYGQTQLERGLAWFEYSMFFRERYRVPLSIAFAFVATHNHFVLDRGGKIFNRTAPVIKLPATATENEHLSLLGLLNSSTACFWMKQMFFNRGSTVDQKGARQRTLPFEDFWEHDGTKLQQFPVPDERPIHQAQELDRLARELAGASPRELLKESASRDLLDQTRQHAASLERRMIAAQEELDWQAYRLYGLLEDPLEADPSQIPEVSLGERPFEIVLARKMAVSEIESKWFERHGSTPITEIPSHWPEPYRQLVEKRILAIEDNPSIALIEQPEYKRRWNRESWEEQEKRALRDWLLDRLEDRRYWPEPRVVSTARLADLIRQDPEFRQIAALYRGRDDFDWTELVTELTMDEAVPFLASLRYTDSGQRKRAAWEETWRLQRLEDAGEKVETIPVPPRYASADFQRSSYWRLRGKLDVPKERFILYPGLERAGDPTPVVGWAGWNHLEQAQALAVAFNDLREKEGWVADRLVPVLAGLLELLPWLLQWHNEPDPAHGGERLGKFFSDFLDEAARPLGLTRDTLAAWRPEEKKTGRRGGRKKKSEDPGLFTE